MSRPHQDVFSVITLMRKQVEFNFLHQELSNYFKNYILRLQFTVKQNLSSLSSNSHK